MDASLPHMHVVNTPNSSLSIYCGNVPDCNSRYGIIFDLEQSARAHEGETPEWSGAKRNHQIISESSSAQKERHRSEAEERRTQKIESTSTSPLWMKQAVKTIVFGPLHTKTSVSANRAKMKWSLFVLILMGQCCFFMCQLYEYHFIGENKTWKEAQKYCKEKYTDLATVYNMTDMERLNNSRKTQAEAWTGLYNNPGINNRTWHWSLPGLEYNDSEAKWGHGEPNDYGGHIENCGAIRRQNKKWLDEGCDTQHAFICYDENKRPTDPYCVINEKMTWSQAQKYCRDKHTDLISGLTQLNQVKDHLLNPPTENFWIGLFRDTWRWSDGSSSSFRNWDPEVGDKNCALLKSSGQWRSAGCDETKPFFCYDDEVILIKERKTWEEALDYCRDHYRQLVSITNPHQQRWVQKRAKNADTPYVWLGLRYTCALDLWFWVSDQLVSYNNWDPEGRTDWCYDSAAMERGGQHKWVKKTHTEMFNFICAL